MRLTVQTDFALRLLMYLAFNEGRLTKISEISECFDISNNHLMKVAHTLGRQGVIETMRGRAGGVRLARPAEEICLGEVVRSLESCGALVECFRPDKGACVAMPACRLKGILWEAAELFFAHLDKFSLADLTKGNHGLKALLASEQTRL